MVVFVSQKTGNVGRPIETRPEPARDGLRAERERTTIRPRSSGPCGGAARRGSRESDARAGCAFSFLIVHFSSAGGERIEVFEQSRTGLTG